MQINESADSATQDPCAHPSSKDLDKWKNLAHLSWTFQAVLHKQMKWSPEQMEASETHHSLQLKPTAFKSSASLSWQLHFFGHDKTTCCSQWQGPKWCTVNYVEKWEASLCCCYYRVIFAHSPGGRAAFNSSLLCPLLCSLCFVH